nr:hypothetical protein [Solirubrobacterales bacterium]
MIVEVPDIGDFTDVPIVEMLVSVGDTVAVEDPLIVLETDKASFEVPAPEAGTVAELLVEVGSLVQQGTPIARLEPAEGDASAETGGAGATGSDGDGATTAGTDAGEEPS